MPGQWVEVKLKRRGRVPGHVLAVDPSSRRYRQLEHRRFVVRLKDGGYRRVHYNDMSPLDVITELGLLVSE